MLHAMADEGEVLILGMAVSSRYPMSAPVVDAINTYYNRADIPIGAPKNGCGVYRGDSVFLNKVAAEFPHSISSNEEAPDAAALYRKILSREEDDSVRICTIGYMSNLENLLKSPPDDISFLNGFELVAKKVSEWICMGGNFPVDTAKDNVNFTRDASAAVYTIRNWPGKITFVGREIGHTIFAGNVLKDTSAANPVRRAYELHRSHYNPMGDWNHHTADPSTVLYAVRGIRDYWKEETGYIVLKDDCSFQWKKAQGTKQKRLIPKMERSMLGRIMEELMVRLPAVLTNDSS